MTDLYQRLDDALGGAADERQREKRRASRMTLPEDPEKWVREYRDYADQLPEHLPQKDVMLRHAELALARLADGDEDEAKFYMLQLQENWNNAEHDRWVEGVEKQYRHAAERRNAELRPLNEARWMRWREEAERIAAEYPKFAGNKSELARRVKRNLQLNESERAIRNRL